MKKYILPFYILREHVGPFFFGFSIITLIFLLNLLFRELSRILSKGLPWNVVVEFFILNMAWIVALAVPMAVLVATLMAFGRLSADNEITAMKANGVSLYRIIAPVLLATAVITVSMVWFNNHVLPDFNHRARLLAGDIAQKRPTVSIEPGVWYDDIPDYGILVQQLEDSAGITKAQHLLIDDHSDPEKSRTISAQRGYIELSQRSGALVMTLFDGEVQELDIKKPEEFRRVIFSKHVLSIAVSDMFLRRSESEYRGDREKSAQQMRREVGYAQAQIADCLQQINQSVARDLQRVFGTNFGIANVSKNSWTHPPSSATNHLENLLQTERRVLDEIDNQLSIMHSYERTTKSLLVEIYKKYSIPVSCIVFVLIGAPLGVMARRGGIATSGGLSLSFFLLYWAFLIGGEDLADRQFISPFLGMWSANLIVGAAGLYILWRTAREHLALDFKKLWPWWKEKPVVSSQ